MTRQGGWAPTGFGTRLREIRQGAKLSQQQVADLAGCHRFTIAKMERGEQEPAWPLVLAICKALNVSCAAFTEMPGDTIPQRGGRPDNEPRASKKRKPRNGGSKE